MQKWGENENIKVYCTKNMENIPLPDEIFLKIFDHLKNFYLAKVAQVSKRLNSEIVI